MYEDSPPTQASTAEVVEELLRQLVDARFVLTDRDGAVTRWSRPAERLFGWPAPRMLGRPLPETLKLGADLPRSGGQVETSVRRKDGEIFEVALTLVPVSMSQSLEFNGFLEALEIAAPSGNLMAQLQQSHHTVVEWIHAAIEGRTDLEADGLSAGTIVAFRPIGAPPPPPEDEELPPPDPNSVELIEVSRVEPVRARAGAGVEQLLGQTAAELAEARADAEAARTQTAETSARLAELEQAGAGLVSGLSDARSALDEMRAQLDGLRERLEQAPATDADQVREEGERLSREAEQGRVGLNGIAHS
jgi:PAS domain S-box-containing protein